MCTCNRWCAPARAIGAASEFWNKYASAPTVPPASPISWTGRRDSGAMHVSATSTHPLDHPIWSALTTRQQALAEGGTLARRYPPAVAPFAAMTDMSTESFAALGALMTASD